jgi:predicted RNA binding protein YcfA (HicA-like mRNA interferase family)
MTQKAKKIKNIFNNSKDVRFLDLDQILTDYGYEKRQSGKGSSHYVYSHPEINNLIVLVSHGKNDTIPEYQVKKALNSIKFLENK